MNSTGKVLIVLAQGAEFDPQNTYENAGPGNVWLKPQYREDGPGWSSGQPARPDHQVLVTARPCSSKKQGGQYLQNDIWGWLLTSTCVSPPLTHTKKTWAQIDESRVLWRDVILTSDPRGRPQNTTERLFYLMSLVKHTQPARTKCGKADSSPTEGAAQQILAVYESLT